MVKTNLVMPNSLLDVDINSHVEVKNPLRYPKRYLGSKEEKQKQIAEDLANDDISTDEEFTKLENDVRKRRLDEFLGDDSGSDKETLVKNRRLLKMQVLRCKWVCQPKDSTSVYGTHRTRKTHTSM